MPSALAYRPLFLLFAAGSVLCCVLIARTPDTEADRSQVRPTSYPGHGIKRQENRLVVRLMIANLLNGAGIGAIGPLIAYWFAVRFGKGPAEIGPLMAGGFLMAAVASVATGWVSRWFGMVRTVIVMRIVGLGLLIALPLSPSFGLAASLYILRTMFNRGTTGARSALNISIVRAHRRGFAASMGNVSMQVPRAVSPLLTGILFAANNLALPFFIGAVFQAGYLVMYYSSFRWVDDATSEHHAADPQVTPVRVAETQPSR
jgi:MFS family permease